MKKVVFENDIIKVIETGKDYDFFAYIENKTDKNISIYFDASEEEFGVIKINANDWVGLLCCEEDYQVYQALINEDFIINVKEQQ